MMFQVGREESAKKPKPITCIGIKRAPLDLLRMTKDTRKWIMLQILIMTIA